MLTDNERRRVSWVFAVTLVMAIFEMAGVVSIMPFIAVLANPEIIDRNIHFRRVKSLFGFASRDSMLFFLGFATLFVLVAGTFLRALTLWTQLRFTNRLNVALAARLVRGYLRQPYEWFLARHGAELSANVLSEVNYVVQGAYFTTLILLTNILISLAIASLLVIVDPFLAVCMVAILGSVYLIVFLSVRKLVAKAGAERSEANTERFRVLNEAFGGIKEISLGGHEAVFFDRFQKPSLLLARRSIMTAMLSDLPSFVLQALVFGGMVALLLYLMAAHGGVERALPIIALYALAGYKLLPALQGIYRGFTQLRFMMPAAAILRREIEAIDANDASTDSDHPLTKLGLRQQLELMGIVYKYPSAEAPTIRAIDLKIPAFSSIGVVGTTGSGKTTLIDVILGLLRPSEGQVLVDGAVVDSANIRAWQRSIGYVPQHIFLSDDSVAANIAFGVPTHAIDLGAVERASRIADLHDFVSTQLPLGYQTTIGERGVRLSGGQRQRIGIARALYRDPDLLVLDEATSALDNVTEHRVMEAIKSLTARKTVILIAHRLSTVQQCDQILLLQDGRVAASGTYHELVRHNTLFRDMARASRR